MAIDLPKILKTLAIGVIASVGLVCIAAFLFMVTLPWPGLHF
jgi:hypothetical protein